jgi:hypothetical protein
MTSGRIVPSVMNQPYPAQRSPELTAPFTRDLVTGTNLAPRREFRIVLSG